MYIRIVTFRLHEMTDDQYERHAVRIASAFTAWSGLRAKFWLADRPQRLFGGIYLFDSRAHADKSRSTPLFTGMVDNPAFADLSIQEFDLLTAPRCAPRGSDRRIVDAPTRWPSLSSSPWMRW